MEQAQDPGQFQGSFNLLERWPFQRGLARRLLEGNDGQAHNKCTMCIKVNYIMSRCLAPM